MTDRIRGTFGRVAVGTTATQVDAGNRSRAGILVKPIDGTVYVGDSAAVTAATGFPLAAGEGLELTNVEAVWAVAGSGTVDVAVIEEEA